jgi:hypothetical protein
MCFYQSVLEKQPFFIRMTVSLCTLCIDIGGVTRHGVGFAALLLGLSKV